MRPQVHDPSSVTAFLFSDIEGSTRLWEEDPERMRAALARHDALTRAAVEVQGGTVVKMTGDGVYAAFADARNALDAVLELQKALVDPAATGGVSLRVRCGLHLGEVEHRDNDYFGTAVNRTARIMGVAHGGQVIMSEAVFDRIAERLPPEVSLRDLGWVRLRDLASPEHIYQVMHPQLRREFPALRSLDATPNNLPQQLTSFVGRERTLAEVRELLRKTRLLTVVGVGGLGKTRLSLQVAAEALDDYPDGVWFVELAPIADERLVVQAVASMLGVKSEGARPVQEALLKFVKDRCLLLILDNCEHLPHACAKLAKDLLQAGARMKVLASSRESLHVVGETAYPLPTLALPEQMKNLTIAALTQCEAVHLFRDRATAALPTFRITDRNAMAVADVCRRLDGIPLALELAAARVRALSVETIAERLTDRFRLLTQGDTTALPRQQTLRACIDWSHDLLTEPERTLLRRLAVFAGGWTLRAAEAVGAGGRVATTDVLDLLTLLVEKSLVEFDAEAPRYRLLETVRQYAQELLDASGEGDEVRTRHVVFYTALVEEARPMLLGPEQGKWFATLDCELENLLLAHRWCDHAAGGALLGLTLLSTMRRYWVDRGLVVLGHRVTVEALARPGAKERSLPRSRALRAVGWLAYVMGRYAEAQGYLAESMEIAREIGDKDCEAAALVLLGMASIGEERRLAARGHLDKALALARGLGNTRRLAVALNSLAELERLEGNLAAAQPLYEESLALDRTLGDRDGMAAELLNLARVAIIRGFGDRARDLLLEAIAIDKEISSKYLAPWILEVSAGLAASREKWQDAARFYAAAETRLEELGSQREPVDAAFLMPLIANTRDKLGESVFAAAEAAGRALSYEESIAGARAWLEHRS
jgi:predicted ATPase/class 3 adenylate cyclase